MFGGSSTCPLPANLIQVLWENPDGRWSGKDSPIKKGHSADQLVANLHQADVDLGKGLTVSEVCKQLGISEPTYNRWRTKYGGIDPLLANQRRVADTRPRFGCKHVPPVLLESRRKVGFGQVHQLWKQQRIQVPQKRQRKRRLPGHSNYGGICYQASRCNQVWSCNFLTERTEDERGLKILVVLDEFTRECLAIEATHSFMSRDVILTLQYLFTVRGAPQHLRSDNGPAFIACAIQRWLQCAQINTLYINNGSPWKNDYVESFYEKLRDKLLNRELFLNLAKARSVLDEWRRNSNHRQPHNSLGWRIPATFAAETNTDNDPADGAFPSVLQADHVAGAAPLPTDQPAQSLPILSQDLPQDSQEDQCSPIHLTHR